MWVVNILIYTHLHIMMSSWGGPLKIHNIQEIVEIELMFEHICMFFFVVFLSSLQMIRKEETNNKKGESTKHITILYSSIMHVNSSLLLSVHQ